MMNKKTRRLSNFAEETREEVKTVFKYCNPIIDEDGTKLRDLDSGSADYVRTGLSVRMCTYTCTIFIYTYMM